MYIWIAKPYRFTSFNNIYKHGIAKEYLEVGERITFAWSNISVSTKYVFILLYADTCTNTICPTEGITLLKVRAAPFKGTVSQDRSGSWDWFLNGDCGRKPQVNLRSRARCSHSIGRSVQTDQWRALDLSLTWGLLPTVPSKESISGDTMGCFRPRYSTVSPACGFDNCGRWKTPWIHINIQYTYSLRFTPKARW